MDTTKYEPKPYETALFAQDLEPRHYAGDVAPEPPPDAMAYLRAMEDAARAGVPFHHYSEDQLARLEELAERHCGIDSDFCTGADD